jgi:restriction endonuclease
MSVRRPGEELEIFAAEYLRLAGYSVTDEKIIGHKKVDLYAEKREFSSVRRYGVECKDYTARLTAKQVQGILVDYQHLYDANLIDVILIITRNGLSPAAQSCVDSCRLLVHQTLTELRNSILDFSSYLDFLMMEYEREGLDRYYVPARHVPEGVQVGEEQDLESDVVHWANRESSQPLALLAGYGAGKTTFLKHMANHFVHEFRKGEAERIPIYIPLGEICSEQSIEGLLGRCFTSTHKVHGYTFSAFDELNRIGAFVLLLDGFDEMKHSMTPHVFRFTFREVLKLVVPGSRVILAGRPSAFLSDAERKEFLHATRSVHGRDLPIGDRPDFHEIQLAPFGERQISSFVDKYADYVSSRPGRGLPAPSVDVFLSSSTLRHLSSRPIQLRMLFEILPGYDGDPDRITVRELYTFFVDMLLDREAEKPARKRLAPILRRRFLANLSFLLWFKSKGHINCDDIPEACFVGTQEHWHESELRRDLLSGSFLEVRYPAEVYFPHRSIQEFLLAEFLLDFFERKHYTRRLVDACDAQIDWKYVENHLSPEVIDFMVSASSMQQRKLALDLIGSYRLRETSIRFWLSDKNSFDELFEWAKAGTMWALVLVVHGREARLPGFEPHFDEDVFALCMKMVSPARAPDRASLYQAVLTAWRFASIKEPNTASIAEKRMTMIVRRLIEYRQQKVVSGRQKKVPPDFVVQLLKQVRFHQHSFALTHMCDVLLNAREEIPGIAAWFQSKSSYVTQIPRDDDLRKIIEGIRRV